MSIAFWGTVIYVDDVPSVADFYRRAFGLTIKLQDEALGFAELDTGTAVLAFASHSLCEYLMPGAYTRPVGGGPQAVEVAFLTNDVGAAFARAVDAGATPIAEPKLMPWGLIVAYLRAPEGTYIGFSTPPHRREGGGE